MRGFNGIILLALALPAISNAAEPEWKARLTRLPPGDFSMPEACELTYHLSWSNVLKAGEARIFFSGKGQNGQKSGEIYAKAQVRSTGLARGLWPYDATTESWVDRETLQPIRDSQEEEDRNERNVYRTTFTPLNVTNEWATIVKKPGIKPVTRNRVYPQTDPCVHDMMSAMLFLRSLPSDHLDKPISLVCYPFRDAYLITVKPMGKEPHAMLGRTVPSMKFGVTLSKIESDQSLKVYDTKMTYAHFWVSDDGLRLPLELRANIFIGSVMVTLKGYREMGAGSPKNGTKPLVTEAKGRRPLLKRNRS